MTFSYPSRTSLTPGRWTCVSGGRSLRRVTGKKRRWGYFVWVVAGAVIGVPEIWAAADKDDLPFATISETVGHLERHHPWVELVVVSLIVLAVYATTRKPAEQAGAAQTPGGRLTLRAAPPAQSEEFDDEDAPWLFGVGAIAACALVAGLTWLAAATWDDPNDYHAGYLLYGSLALLWIVVPSALALFLAKDMPFPPLVRSVRNLEDWLRARRPPVGPALAWIVGYVILAGLVILLLHLALYPYPDITKVLNPNG